MTIYRGFLASSSFKDPEDLAHYPLRLTIWNRFLEEVIVLRFAPLDSINVLDVLKTKFPEAQGIITTTLEGSKFFVVIVMR